MSYNIVLDTGASTIKGGLSEHETVMARVPTMIGEPLQIYQDLDKKLKELYFGQDAMELMPKLQLTRPIQNGVVQDWDDMMKLWIVTISQLKCEPIDSNVLLTQQPINDPDFRSNAAEIFFETFQISSLNYISQALAGMYQSGITTGVVYYSGESQSQIQPIYEGFQLQKAQVNNIIGNLLTSYFKQLIHNETHIRFNQASEFELVRMLKEQHCFLCKDFEEQQKKDFFKLIELPNSQQIKLKNSLYQVPQVFFMPSFVHLDQLGLHKQINDLIKNCDVNIQDNLYSNLILVGGNTLFTNFDKRLQSEMAQIAPGKNIRIHGGPNRVDQVYEGAVIVSNLPTPEDQLITKFQYQEEGASLVARKHNC